VTKRSLGRIISRFHTLNERERPQALLHFEDLRSRPDSLGAAASSAVLQQQTDFGPLVFPWLDDRVAA
jgi:hypothetical protein